MDGIHDDIARELRDFGGVLRCTVCEREEPLGGVAWKLRHGWPKCDGYTMRWVTARELSGHAAATTEEARGEEG